ncbi:ABC transporter permease [Paraglaciecola arctica]|uniref:ABC transporter permease n=1 Tax=Paraglaciecola arctica TaxID=1128911 RepID=UPI001C07DB88|nr:ABC transporter permease [Paraglaciecola arctica]MBU3004586.1 ABC transporter permease [Paraglaciecola arctica]
MSQFIYQLKQAWVSLKKKVGFVATVVTTMGTTLGALLCVLTLGYLLIIEPLPYPEQDKLYKVIHAIGDKTGETNAQSFTYPGIIHLYKNQDVFEKVALIQYGQDVLTSLPTQPTLNTAYATPEWFELLGANMQMGRTFETSEGLDTFTPVAVISYKTWQQEFASAADMLDKKVSFSGVSFRVIGVLGEDFIEPQIKGAGRDVGMWFPWDYNLDVRMKERWGNISGALTFVGKLKDTVTASQAEQTLTPLVNDAWVENVASIPFFNGWSVRVELESFQTAIVGDSQNTVYKLLAGVIGLVLIAFANIANLFMSRTAEQQRHLAIYAALGAKKSHLFRGLLAESGLLMGLSLLLALVVASLGFSLLQSNLASQLPRISELGVSHITLLASVLLAVFFALLFAFLSSNMINYRALNSMLQSSGKGTGIQVSKRFRQGLIVSQVAIATLLVFANITLFKEAMDSINLEPGYSVDNMQQMSLSVSAPEFPPEEEVAAVMTELKQKLLQMPEVESLSQSSSVLNGFGLWALTAIASGENFTPESKRVSHNYFTLFGQELLEGDYFSEADIKDGNLAMIVNDVFAQRLNPTGSALGMQISGGGPDNIFTIVGVVKGVIMPAQTEMPMRVYTPSNSGTSQITLKLKQGQTVNREQVATAIGEVSNLYALFSLDTLEGEKKRRLFTQYTTAITTSVLAIITLFLASVGLYGILSYGTQMRRFELGTRMAIGAKRKDLVNLIVKDNAWVIVLGVAFSIVILLGVYLAYNEVLSAYMSADLLPMFVSTVLSITVLSIFACYWPLRQYINHPAIRSLRGSD